MCNAQGLLKKLDALELDIDNFNNNIGELAALSQGLVQRGHFDSANIQQQQVLPLRAHAHVNTGHAGYNW